jgi:hypothetical protein
MQGSALLTGRSSKQVARQLRAHGFDMAAPPESFVVTRQNRLVPDESERAREWGSKLAEIAARLGVTRQGVQQRWGRNGRELTALCRSLRSAGRYHQDARAARSPSSPPTSGRWSSSRPLLAWRTFG